MPGLIDCNVHFVSVSSGNPLDWIIGSNYRQAIRTENEVKKVLDSGFTTAVSCGSSEWAQRADPVAQRVDGVEEIRKAVRQRLGQNVDHIKFVATGGGVWEKDRGEDMHYSFEEIKAIVEEAHMVGLRVMCHAENLQAIRAAVELGVEMIEHGDTEEGCELDKALCKEMANKNISIIPTLSVSCVGKWAVKEIPRYIINVWKRTIRHGVKILLGADAYAAPVTPYGAFNIGEIKLLVDILGMTPLEAITSGTKYGAEACGLGEKVGTVEKGKLADLLVVKKDPLPSKLYGWAKYRL